MSRRADLTLNALFEASLIDLKEIVLAERSCSDPALLFYAKAMLLYREGEISALSDLISESEARLIEGSSGTFGVAFELAKMRVLVRNRQVAVDHLEELESRLPDSKPWKAESLFVLAMAYECAGDHSASKRCYQRSYRLFAESDCPRKALKALLNSVAAESRIFPEKRLLNDYHFIYRKARACSEASIAAIALLNISREYQKLGARVCALNYVNRALALLDSSEFGSQQRDLAVAHRCHLLIELGRTYEAGNNLDQIRSSPFIEVKAAVIVLEGLRSHGDTQRSKDSGQVGFLPTWVERLGEHASKGLTQLEQDLLICIGEGPKTKFDLVRILYGNHLRFSIAENRLNNLINRLRRKLPDLILMRDGKYELADEIFLGSSERIGP